MNRRRLSECDGFIRPTIAENIYQMVSDIMTETGERAIVSIGLAKGYLLNGEPMDLATPVGLVRLFEDDGAGL